MNAISRMFAALKQENQTALMPFLTAGDPDLEFTREAILALQDTGCHLLELGFPYSDPVADGPVIQESYVRALESGVTVDKIFDMMRGISGDLKIPVVSMVSYSIIFRIGIEEFIKTAAECGFAGAIVPDLPLEEIADFQAVASKYEFALNPLVTPATPADRAIKIAQAASGFVYFVSVVGITGEKSSFAETLEARISTLREQVEAPICIGFGISGPEQVRQLSPLADGLIVGSALVRRIASGFADDASATKNREATKHELSSFAASLISALS